MAGFDGLALFRRHGGGNSTKVADPAVIQSEPLCDDFRTRIIEAEPINDRFIRDRAKQSRRRIPGLRVPRDCPKLAKPEAEGCPRGHRFSLFIHACGQSNWM